MTIGVACPPRRFFVCPCSLYRCRICVQHGIVVGKDIAIVMCVCLGSGTATCTLSFGNLFSNAVLGTYLLCAIYCTCCSTFGLSSFQIDLLIAVNTSFVVHIAGGHLLFFTLLYAGAVAFRSIKAIRKLPIETIFDNEVVGVAVGFETNTVFCVALKGPRTFSSYLLIHICAESITCSISSGM